MAADEGGYRAEWAGGACAGGAWGAGFPGACPKGFRLQVLDFAGRGGQLSDGGDAAGVVQESLDAAVGWRDRQCRGVCAAGGHEPVHDFRHQLRASWMPGAVVPAVAAVHVSLPWGRLLRRWFAGFGTSGAGAVHLRLQNSWRTVTN